MTDSIYLMHADNTLAQVRQAPHTLESDIQELLDRYPELLTGAQKSPESPFPVLRSDEARAQFFSAMMWVIETTRAAA